MNTNRDEIYKVVQNILQEHCEIRKDIRVDSKLGEDLGLESLGFLTLALELENYYQLILEEEPENPPRTVLELIELVEKRLEAEAS